MSGCTDDKVLIMGATNRPQELDDAVLRYTKAKTLKVLLDNNFFFQSKDFLLIFVLRELAQEIALAVLLTFPNDKNEKFER